ncbi:MAG: hypothetical protein GX758_03580 [Tenericutes bacterium]|nr:hypothetical protein [Mycoplasmatota bacterium]
MKENSFLTNKVVLKYCPEYYRIINEEFNEFDMMSDKVIQIYQNFIFSIDVTNKLEIKLITQLNKAVVRYFDDMEFKSALSKSLMSLKVPKNSTDVMSIIVNTIIKEYDKYMEGFTRNIYIPKWI